MATPPRTPAQRQQELAQQHELVRATLDYLLEQQVRQGRREVAGYFQHLKHEAAELARRQRLPRLKQWLWELAAAPLIADAAGYGAYVRQATGLPIDVPAEFAQHVAAIQRRGRIRSRAEYDEVRTRIDMLRQPGQQTQREQLQALVAAYESFIAQQLVGKLRF